MLCGSSVVWPDPPRTPWGPVRCGRNAGRMLLRCCFDAGCLSVRSRFDTHSRQLDDPSSSGDGGLSSLQLIHRATIFCGTPDPVIAQQCSWVAGVSSWHGSFTACSRLLNPRICSDERTIARYGDCSIPMFNYQALESSDKAPSRRDGVSMFVMDRKGHYTSEKVVHLDRAE